MKHFWDKIIKCATSPVGIVFWATLIIHVIIAKVLDNGTLQFSLAGDQVVYHEWGTQIANLIKSGAYHWNDVYPFHWYPLFVGILYVIFGSSMLIGSLWNVVLVACSAILAYKILRNLNLSEKYSALASFVIMNGYASFVFHGSVLLKESWIVFFVLAMTYISMRIARGQGNRIALFGVFIILYLLLRDLRYFVAFAVAIAFLMEWLVNARMVITKRIATGVVMAVALAGITLATVGDGMIRSAGFSPTSIPTESRSIQVLSTSNTLPSSGLSEGGIHEQPAFHDHPIFGGKIGAAIATFFGPLPGQVTLGKFITSFSDVLFVWVLVIIGLAGIAIRRLDGLREVVPLAACATLILGPIAFASTNIGWIIRQRIPGIVLVAIIAAYYAPSVWNAAKERRFTKP